jgi:hypothetical protein
VYEFTPHHERRPTVKKLLAILAIGGLLSVGCNAESSKGSGSHKTTAPPAPSKMAPSPSTGAAPAPSPPPSSDAGKGADKKSTAPAKPDKPGKP